MPYIDLPEGVPGIRSLAMYRPETGKHLYDLAQVLLRGPSPLTEAEREMIATFVSSRNNCSFCANSHGAAAKHLLGNDAGVVDDVLHDFLSAKVSDKMKALLNIAGQVQILGKAVKQYDIDLARDSGATDLDIHDTVLIAATFSMFNRYVDGLATIVPKDPAEYVEMGKRLAEKGYSIPQPEPAQ
jgi:uncharacterized peroxidase-related enzyme